MAEGVRRADEVECRLLVARDDADGEARAALDLSDGFAAVLRIAQRGRRKGGDARDVEALQEPREFLEDLDGLVDARLRHDAVLHVRREADDVLLLQQHLDVAATDVIDGHADRARTDVNDAVEHRRCPFFLVRRNRCSY